MKDTAPTHPSRGRALPMSIIAYPPTPHRLAVRLGGSAILHLLVGPSQPIAPKSPRRSWTKTSVHSIHTPQGGS